MRKSIINNLIEDYINGTIDSSDIMLDIADVSIDEIRLYAQQRIARTTGLPFQ